MWLKNITLLCIVNGLIMGFMGASNAASPIGNSNLCIPQDQLLPLSSNQDKQSFDSPPHVYEAFSISWQEMQSKISGYIGVIEVNGYKRYHPLHVTITEQKDSQIPEFPENPYVIDDDLPRLVGSHPNKIIMWDVFEGNREQHNFWGYCSFENFKQQGAVECTRHFTEYDLSFYYRIHQDNLKHYPEIDQFLRNKLKKRECE